MPPLRHWLRPIPNLISCARIVLVPVTVFALLRGEYDLSLWLFIVAGVSDALDGAIARLARVQSVLGTYLDPLADKLLLVSVYWALSTQGLLIWAVTLAVLLRDGMILGGYLWCRWRRWPFDIQPILISKVNTFLQVFVVAWILSLEAGWLAQMASPAAADRLTLLLEVAMIATTVLSGFFYAGRWHRLIQGAKGRL